MRLKKHSICRLLKKKKHNHHGIILGYTDPEDMVSLEKAKAMK